LIASEIERDLFLISRAFDAATEALPAWMIAFGPHGRSCQRAILYFPANVPNALAVGSRLWRHWSVLMVRVADARLGLFPGLVPFFLLWPISYRDIESWY